MIYQDSVATVDSLDKALDTIHDFSTYDVENLERNKTYSFRVFQLRNGIPSAGSNVITVTTRTGEPLPVVLGKIGGIDKSDTAVTLRWSKSSATNDFYRYAVIVDTVSIVDTFTTFDSTNSKVFLLKKITDTTKTISPLLLNKKYWFCVYTIDTTGLYSVSNVESTTTDDGLPNGVAVSVKTVADTILINWTKSDFASFKEYRVYRSATGEGADSSGTLVATITDRDSLSLKRVLATPAIEWYRVYTVSTTGVMGAGYPAVSYPVLLSALPCDSPYTGVHLSWTRTLLPDSLFSSYKVYRSETPATLTAAGVAITPLIVKSEDVDYIDLTADSGSTYYYRIEHNAVNELGYKVGQFSNEIAVSTEYLPAPMRHEDKIRQ